MGRWGGVERQRRVARDLLVDEAERKRNKRRDC